MHALVTGGAGFIGCELSRVLVAAGYDVTAVDNLMPQVHPRRVRPARLDPAAELVVADVTDVRTWDGLLPTRPLDLVIHLAAETGTGQSMTESTRHGMVNVVGTTQLLDAMLRHDRLPQQLVLSSSRAVYGEGGWLRADGTVAYPGPRDDAALSRAEWTPADPHGPLVRALPSAAPRTPPSPTSMYAATKLAQEHLCRAWSTANAVPLTVLRLQNVYGPGQSLTNAYTGIVTLFSTLAAQGRSADVFEDGDVVRDFVYIDDVVDAFARVLTKSSPGVRTLDVGSGTSTRLIELAELVAQLTGAPPPRVTGAYRAGDVRASICDITAAEEELGFSPQWDLRRGLEALLRWVADEAGSAS